MPLQGTGRGGQRGTLVVHWGKVRFVPIEIIVILMVTLVDITDIQLSKGRGAKVIPSCGTIMKSL